MRYKYLIYILIIILPISLADCRHRNRDKPERGHMYFTHKHSVVKMRKADGVYYVPCKINGTEMEFILDTGASNITMSLTEVLFLYKQRKLTDDDFIGKQQYQIADGSIHEGMTVILRKVEIGDWLLNNVQASIVNSMEAPLLLGQSALAAFGKIAIDYNRNEITFE